MPNGSSNNTIGSAVQKEASLPTDMLLEYQRKDFRKALDIPDSSRMPPLVRTILIIAFFTVGLLLCATVSFGAVQFIRNVAQVQPSPTFEIPIATFSPTVTVTFTFTPPSTATQSPMNTYTPTPTNVTPTPEKPKAVFIEGCVTSNGLRFLQSQTLKPSQSRG